MKKITFIVFALITGSIFAQDSGTATVRAEIVEAINIEDGSELYFGKIDAAGGGNVRVAADGTRTFSNNDMRITSTVAPTAALFKVTAANTISYNVSIPSIVLTGAGDDMNVSFTHDVNGEEGSTIIGTGTAQDLKVGGLLNVASSQAAGEYTGTVTVTVSYE